MPPDIDHPGVYIEEIPSGARPIQAVPTDVAAFIGESTRGPRTKPVEIDSLAAFEKTFGRGSLLHTALFLFFQNGGKRAVVMRARDGGLKAFFQALHTLDEVEDVNLLCLPTEGPLDPDKVVKAAAYCLENRIFLLLDANSDWLTEVDVAVGLGTLPAGNPNAALYFPRLQGNGGLGIPPSGALAGIIARTDHDHGVWKAPAGMDSDLRSARGLLTPVDDSLAGALTQLSVNPLKQDPNGRILAWGARTLAGNDNEWRYIPVRRTALFIEESIERGTRWVVFEGNDEPLWAQLRTGVTEFLFGLFRAGAFQGAKQDEAFFVKCDRSTMTQNDIDEGRVNLLVGFAPLKPAEFVILKFTLKAKTP